MSLHRYTKPGVSNHREIASRSINTFSPKNTAYDRIFSSKYIMTQTIPSFLVQSQSKEGLTQSDLLRLSITQRTHEKVPQNLDLSNSPIRLRACEQTNDRLKINIDKLNDAKNVSRIIHDIFNPTLPSEEVILRFKKRKLTRGDLLCFREGSDLSESVVDCFMSILKVENRVSNQRTDEKIVVVNTNFSKILFQARPSIPKPTINIFDSSLLIIPLYEGYWTLLAVNLKTGVTHYYDGLMPDKEIFSYLVILKRFLIQANIGNLKGIDENFLKYESKKIVPVNMSLKDSGVYICRIAELIAQNREPTSFNFKNLRKDMLNCLVRISLNIA